MLAVRLAVGDRHVSQRALAVGQGHFYALRDSIIIIPSAANDFEVHGNSGRLNFLCGPVAGQCYVLGGHGELVVADLCIRCVPAIEIMRFRGR